MANLNGELDGAFRRQRKRRRGYSDEYNPPQVLVVKDNARKSAEKLCNKLLQQSKSRSAGDLESLSSIEAFKDLIQLLDDISEAVKDAETDNNAAELLPPELSSQLLRDSAQLRSINGLLFLDKQLVDATIYSKFTLYGQNKIHVEASNLWDTLVGLIAGLQSPHDPSTVLRPLLKAISDGSQKLNNLTRQYLLQSDPFHDPGVLEKITKGKSKHMVDLGLVSDAMLRSQNIEKRPNSFNNRYPGKEVVSGKEDGQGDESLTHPGQLNDIDVIAQLDTGAHCNLIAQKWLKRNIHVDVKSSRTQTLKMADGRQCQDLPCIDVTWSFSGKEKVWTDVEFVVLDEVDYDVLLGLPFLKRSQMIHNSDGIVVHAELKHLQVPEKKTAIPIYAVSKKGTGSRG